MSWWHWVLIGLGLVAVALIGLWAALRSFVSTLFRGGRGS